VVSVFVGGLASWVWDLLDLGSQWTRSGEVMRELLNSGGVVVSSVLLAAVLLVFGRGRLSRAESETRVVLIGRAATLCFCCLDLRAAWMLR
jgi:hypothetical protein